MKIFKKISRFFTFLTSLSILLSAYVSMACSIYIDDITSLCDDSIVFSASYSSRYSDETINLEGVLGAHTLRLERFGQYIMDSLPQQSVCKIVENNSSNYDMQLNTPPEGGSGKWHIERPDGCSYWELTPQGSTNSYERKVYIDRVPDSAAWKIYMTTNYSGEKVIQKLAIVNFDYDVYGEIEDLVNFAIFIIMYSGSCETRYKF